jgi:hypothetical protein
VNPLTGEILLQSLCLNPSAIVRTTAIYCCGFEFKMESAHNEQTSKDQSAAASFQLPQNHGQSQPQYSQAQPSYAYNAAADYPPLPEHDLGISSQQFGRPIENDFTAHLVAAAQDAAGRNGDNSMRIDTLGSSAHGIALPNQQATQQNFSPAGPRGSVDVTPDSATLGGKSKSTAKASQACDECRRKKVSFTS